MRKIAIIGDIHEYFDLLNYFIYQNRPEIIIQCGDFGYFPEKYHNSLRIPNTLPNGRRVPIYFCDGNHEDFATLFSDWRASGGKLEPFEIAPEVYWMPRGSVLELPNGQRACFLGGARSVDRPYGTEGINWFNEELLTMETIKLLPFSADIVISHTAPNFFDIDKHHSPHFDEGWDMTEDKSRDVLDEAFLRLRPKQWYFAHFHLHMMGVYQECEWIALSDATLSGRGNWWAWHL
jgi:hypothetical protein